MESLPWFRAKTVGCLEGELSVRLKLELVLYNWTVGECKKSGTGVIKMTDFLAVYDVFTWCLIFAMAHVLPLIEAGRTKPSQVMDEVVGYCGSFHPGLARCTMADEPRGALRWFMLHKLRRIFVNKKMVIQIEDSIQRHKTAKCDYKRHCFVVLANLGNAKTRFKERILTHLVDLDSVGQMMHRDMWPELWVLPTMQVGHRATVLQSGEGDLSSPSLIQCHSCKQYKVTYYEMQTRSADEPMTCFCTCQHCGKKWKM